MVKLLSIFGYLAALGLVPVLLVFVVFPAIQSRDIGRRVYEENLRRIGDSFRPR